MSEDGFWEFSAWVRVPGKSDDPKGAEQAAERFAAEASKGEFGSVSLEDSEPTFEGDA